MPTDPKRYAMNAVDKWTKDLVKILEWAEDNYLCILDDDTVCTVSPEIDLPVSRTALRALPKDTPALKFRRAGSGVFGKVTVGNVAKAGYRVVDESTLELPWGDTVDAGHDWIQVTLGKLDPGNHGLRGGRE